MKHETCSFWGLCGLVVYLGTILDSGVRTGQAGPGRLPPITS